MITQASKKRTLLCCVAICTIVGGAVLAPARPAEAFDFKKVGKQIKKDFGKAGKGLSKNVKKGLGSNAGRIVTGVAVGALVGAATDSAGAGILAGALVVAAPEVFRTDFSRTYKQDLIWSAQPRSYRKTVVVAPGRQVSEERRRQITEDVRNDVMDLQRALKQLGYYDKSIDGDFGKGSRAAVRDFQTALGAPATGTLTAGQRAELFRQAGAAGLVRSSAFAAPAVAATAITATGSDTPASGPAIAEYSLAKSQFTGLSNDYLAAGPLSAVKGTDMLPDGTISLELQNDQGILSQATGRVTGIYADVHPVSPMWARVFYRAPGAAEPAILNTRDDFASENEAAEWIRKVNDRVALLAKLTGDEANADAGTTVAASPAPEKPAGSEAQASGGTEIAAQPDGRIVIPSSPVEVAANNAGTGTVSDVSPGADACRQNIYVSFHVPEGDDPINHYNIVPPEGTIMMDNGDMTAYFTGNCVQGRYKFSYVHVSEGKKTEDWKHIKRDGEFEIASTAGQCAVNLNTPDGSAELSCY